MRTVRLDDFPSGNPGYNIHESRATVRKAVGIFEAHGVPYLLGVSPLLMDGDDIKFLNEVVKTGSVVMHGHSHMLEYPNWDRIVDTWPYGGEYMGMTANDIRTAYDWGHKLLTLVNRYDHEHFIPPFNCHTQTALDVLATKGVKYWHGCDKEWDAYDYADMNYHGMTPVISPYQTTYHYAHLVLEHLKAHPEDQSQIALHWTFDKDHNGWEVAYNELCDWIRAEDEA